MPVGCAKYGTDKILERSHVVLLMELPLGVSSARVLNAYFLTELWLLRLRSY